MIYARLFGRPEFQLAADLIESLPDQRYQLLAYLAHEREWVGREVLSCLFWPDLPTDEARHNLRQLLRRIKDLSWDAGLEVERHRVRWRVESDVTAFAAALDAGRSEHVLALYRGPFLAGLEQGAAPEFGAWLELERERYEARWRAVAFGRARQLAGTRPLQAFRLSRRLVATDRLDEESLQLHLRLARITGHGQEALALYRQFEAYLANEFGIEPRKSTAELAEAVKQGAMLEPRARTGQGRLVNAPAGLTPFVGRTVEVADLVGLLQSDECRLLTLVGPGGIGKTRVAVVAAVELASGFEGGAVFIPLAAASDASLLASEIATGLGIALYGPLAPEEQLLNALADRSVLLVLDNFEHLLEGTSLISDIMERALGVKLLVTSRERLRLKNEWLFELEGLSLPAKATTVDLEHYDAPRLFIQVARRLEPQFETADSREALARISRALEGSPLGIELAAGWVRLLSCEEIADEVEGKNLEFLSGSVADIPERHSSLARVFDRSWNLLDEVERCVITRLTVFRGGFTREAAAAVADADARTLLALRDKSLLKREGYERFDLHALVRKFAATRLEASRHASDDAFGRHCAYFARFLGEREQGLKGGGVGQRETVNEIERELANVRQAWQLAVTSQDLASLDLMQKCFWFFEIRGLYRDVEAMTRYAQEQLQGESVPLARILMWRGGFQMRRGNDVLAMDLTQQCLDMLERLGAPKEAFPIHGKAVILKARGRLEEARSLLQDVTRLAREAGDDWHLALALADLGIIAVRQGRFAEAEQHYRESIAMCRDTGDQVALSMALNGMGVLKRSLALFNEADRHFQEGLEVAASVGHSRLIAHAYDALGDLAADQGQYQVARRRYRQGLQLWRDLGIDTRAEVTLTKLSEVGQKLT